MKAIKVYESLNFKQGEDPYKTMSIGKYSEPKIGDKFKFNKNVYYTPSDDGDGLYLTPLTGPDKTSPMIYRHERAVILRNENRVYTLSFKKNDYADWDIVPITRKKLKSFIEDNVISKI